MQMGPEAPLRLPLISILPGNAESCGRKQVEVDALFTQGNPNFPVPSRTPDEETISEGVPCTAATPVCPGCFLVTRATQECRRDEENHRVSSLSGLTLGSLS